MLFSYYCCTAFTTYDNLSGRHVWDKENVLIERDNSGTNWASDTVMDMAYEKPEELWDFILEVLSRNRPNEVKEVLAAGPLEDYLAKLGPKVIDKIEKQAGTDAQFKNLLGGVWKNNMTDDVWERVQIFWDRSGWDGN